MSKPTRAEARRIKRLEVCLKALQLRSQGKTYREIGIELGYKNGLKEAHAAVKEGLAYLENEIKTTALEYVALSVLQLDRLLEEAMPYALGLPRTERFIDPDTGEVIEETFQDAPNWQAARLAADLIQTRLKILGLAAPQSIRIDGETPSGSDLLAEKLVELCRNSEELPDDDVPEGDP
jgi:hypothetical protein